MKELSLYSDDLAELMKAVLYKGADFRFKARGHSMEPFIKDGDIITVSSQAHIEEGDIVAFINQNKKLALHRIIGKKSKKIIIKGDNSRKTDGFIDRENILASVKKVERQDRTVETGKGKKIIALLSRVNLLIPCISIVRKFFREFKRIKN